jgi:hypothetical protein
MSVLTRKVISPPYFGVPNLSHQLPVTVVVVGVVVELGFVVVVVLVAVVVVVVLVVVAVGEDVVFVVQDANTRDVTIRQVRTIQMIPFFIQTSLLCNSQYGFSRGYSREFNKMLASLF